MPNLLQDFICFLDSTENAMTPNLFCGLRTNQHNHKMCIGMNNSLMCYRIVRLRKKVALLPLAQKKINFLLDFLALDCQT